jgi:23S rRNA U2552 (ribose-2'-O)-methylase RlmE/FtsJ
VWNVVASNAMRSVHESSWLSSDLHKIDHRRSIDLEQIVFKFVRNTLQFGGGFAATSTSKVTD